MEYTLGTVINKGKGNIVEMCEDVENCYCDEEFIDLEQLVVNKVDLAAMRAKRFNKTIETPKVEEASVRAKGFNQKIDNLVRELQY